MRPKYSPRQTQLMGSMWALGGQSATIANYWQAEQDLELESPCSAPLYTKPLRHLLPLFNHLH